MRSGEQTRNSELGMRNERREEEDGQGLGASAGMPGPCRTSPKRSEGRGEQAKVKGSGRRRNFTRAYPRARFAGDLNIES